MPCTPPGPKMSYRRLQNGRMPPSSLRNPTTLHGSPRFQHDFWLSAKRRLYARVSYRRWMALVAVEDLQKARIKRFVKCFNTLSMKKDLPVSFRVIVALPRRNVSSSCNRCLETMWSCRRLMLWAGTTTCCQSVKIWPTSHPSLHTSPRRIDVRQTRFRTSLMFFKSDACVAFG